MTPNETYWLASPTIDGGRVELPFTDVRVDGRHIFTASLDLDGLDDASQDAIREIRSPDARFEIEQAGIVIYRARILGSELRVGKPFALTGREL